MVSPPRLHVPAMGFAGGESVACTDSRLADCFAECVGQRMQRAPASTMCLMPNVRNPSTVSE